MRWNPFSRPDYSRPKERVPPGRVIYAIGDMHGQGDLAFALLEHIIEEAKSTPDIKYTVIGLGDYIDRGPDSNYILDLLISMKEPAWFSCRFLRGNHEQALLDFLSGKTDGQLWLQFGGLQTLASYNVAAPTSDSSEAIDALRKATKEAVPEAHLQFLNELELSCSYGDYFFAHAGASPGVPLDAQSSEDLIWIRDRFLKDKRRFEKVVVHGHSPTAEVHADARRIGVDTGAYVTGILTALRLEGDRAHLLQAIRSGPVTEPKAVRIEAADLDRRA